MVKLRVKPPFADLLTKAMPVLFLYHLLPTTLLAQKAPVITQNPVETTVVGGEVATFTAAATGINTVQWMYRTATVTQEISGATSPTLSFVAQAQDDQKRYFAIFSNRSGDATTAEAILHVLYPPEVISNPPNLNVTNGTINVQFSIAVRGNPFPQIQWQIASGPGQPFLDLPGRILQVLTLSQVQITDSGKLFRAFVSNPYGSVTTSAGSLNILTEPVILADPKSLTVKVGDVATFSAAASGNPTPFIAWQKSVDNGATFQDIPNPSGATLSFIADTSQNGEQYRARFANSLAPVYTAPATLTVVSPPVVTQSPSSSLAGNLVWPIPFSLHAAASGFPAPIVRWEVSVDSGLSFQTISLPQAGTDLYLMVQPEDNGNLYRAVFSNIVGTATTDIAKMTLLFPPIIKANPLDLRVAVGETATFQVSVLANPPALFQWQLSSDGGVNFTDIPNATEPTLTFSAALDQNGNKYRVTAKNNWGETQISATATLTVENSLKITSAEFLNSGTTIQFGGISPITGSYVLISSDTVDSSAQWTPIQTNTFSAGSTFSFTVTNDLLVGTKQKYYRIRAQ